MNYTFDLSSNKYITDLYYVGPPLASYTLDYGNGMTRTFKVGKLFNFYSRQSRIGLYEECIPYDTPKPTIVQVQQTIVPVSNKPINNKPYVEKRKREYRMSKHESDPKRRRF